MVDRVEGIIYDGLCEHLSTLVLSPTMPVAWENTRYERSKDGFLEPQQFPIPTEQVTLGTNGQNRHIGIFQVTINWPLGKGAETPKHMAGDIIRHFKRGTVITKDGETIKIITPPGIDTGFPEDDFYRLPVSIRYRVDANNPA